MNKLAISVAAALSAGVALAAEEPKIPVSVEAGLNFDSKFMSYGLVDNKDPILTPSAAIGFCDWVKVGVEALFDVTKYGKRWRGADYGNRAGRYQELDPSIAVGHKFSHGEYSWVPELVGSFEFELSYMYEYHPRSMGKYNKYEGESAKLDTQFVTLGLGLPDLWLEPSVEIERDIDRDNGTYVNVEIGHAFALVEGEGEDADPVLEFRPSIGQGFGNKKRVGGYLSNPATEEALYHAGFMDTCVKGELTWRLCDNVSVSGYVAYYDYALDRNMRHTARGYEALGRDDTSYHFVAGCGIALEF